MLRPDNVPTLIHPKMRLPLPVNPKIGRRFTERMIGEMLEAASCRTDNPGPGRVLAGLLESWISAGCDLSKWVLSNPRMVFNLRQCLEDWRAQLWSEDNKKFRPVLMATIGLDVEAEPRDDPEMRVAYDTFAAFVFSAAPLVAIGKCDRCGRFYWNRWGHTNKRFCGRKCSQLQTATEGQEKRLRAEHREKNRRIRRSIQNFISLKPQSSEWRRWAAKDASVSPNYFTRAIHRGAQGKPDGVKFTKKQTEYLTKFDKGGK